METMQENGLYVLNGKTKSDWEGEYTYAGARGCTVIDYAFVNEKVIEKVIDFKVEERMDSDHFPIIVELEAEETRRGKKEEEKRRGEVQEEREIICWDKEARKVYKEKTEEIGWNEVKEDWSVNRKWEELKSIVKKAMIYKK